MGGNSVTTSCISIIVDCSREDTRTHTQVSRTVNHFQVQYIQTELNSVPGQRNAREPQPPPPIPAASSSIPHVRPSLPQVKTSP